VALVCQRWSRVPKGIATEAVWGRGGDHSGRPLSNTISGLAERIAGVLCHLPQVDRCVGVEAAQKRHPAQHQALPCRAAARYTRGGGGGET